MYTAVTDQAAWIDGTQPGVVRLDVCCQTSVYVDGWGDTKKACVALGDGVCPLLCQCMQLSLYCRRTCLDNSGSFLAEISARSPQNCLFLKSLKIGIQVSEKSEKCST